MSIDKEKVIQKFKNTVSYGVYEDEDIEVTSKKIAINLSYDSSINVKLYQDRFKEKFPGAVDVQDTKITLHFDRIKEGATNDQGSNTSTST